MQNIFFSPLLMIFYAIIFGITMKIADLLDEHGLKWFRGSAILFGFLWGIFGALLIFGNSIIANVYLALVMAFILRYRIDYLNHGIAATIMLLTFFASQKIIWNEFVLFFAVFAVFGLLSDCFKTREKPKQSKINVLFRNFTDLRMHYYFLSFIYSLFTGTWLVFFVLSLNMLFYEFTLKYGKKILKK